MVGCVGDDPDVQHCTGPCRDPVDAEARSDLEDAAVTAELADVASGPPTAIELRFEHRPGLGGGE